MASGAKSTVQTAMTPQMQNKMQPSMGPQMGNNPSLYSDSNLGGGIPPQQPLPPVTGPQPMTGPAPTVVSDPGQRAPNVFSSASQGLNTAMGGAQNEMGYRPDRVYNSRYRAQSAGLNPTVAANDVTSNQLATTDLTPYSNPYQTQVIDYALSDLNKARQMQMNQVGANASASGAFGGSRQALREAETNTGFYDQAARTAANLRQQGFNQVQGMAQADIANKLRADLANQQANLQAGTSTAGFQAQNQLANQAAANRAMEFGLGQRQSAQMANQSAGLAGSQQRLAAGNQLANLSNLGFGMGQQLQGNLAQDGAMKQGINQLLIDAVKNQFNQRSQAPFQSIGLLSQALGASPVPQTSTTSKQPGLFDYLTLGASL